MFTVKSNLAEGVTRNHILPQNLVLVSQNYRETTPSSSSPLAISALAHHSCRCFQAMAVCRFLLRRGMTGYFLLCFWQYHCYGCLFVSVFHLIFANHYVVLILGNHFLHSLFSGLDDSPSLFAVSLFFT